MIGSVCNSLMVGVTGLAAPTEPFRGSLSLLHRSCAWSGFQRMREHVSEFFCLARSQGGRRDSNAGVAVQSESFAARHTPS